MYSYSYPIEEYSTLLVLALKFVCIFVSLLLALILIKMHSYSKGLLWTYISIPRYIVELDLMELYSGASHFILKMQDFPTSISVAIIGFNVPSVGVCSLVSSGNLDNSLVLLREQFNRKKELEIRLFLVETVSQL